MKKSNFLSRVIACTLVLSVILSQMIFSSSAATVSAEEANVWDGTTAESFAGGNGSATSPFLIETAEQLHKMVAEYYTHEASLGKYFEITKDIYINNPGTNYTFTGAKDWLTDYGSAIATVSKKNSFSGTLNGNGNKIYGLYISGKKSAGLFPGITSYSDIKNLAFDNVYITGGSGNAGAIAGSAYWYDNNETATITNCSVVNSTIGKGGNIGYVGGLVGHMLDCTITFTDCYSNNLNLSDWGTPGGIVGNAYESGKLFMVNCYSAGHYPVRANVNKAVCTNVYTDTAVPEGNTTENVTVLTTEQMKGEVAKENMAGLDFDWIWETVENGYPVIRENLVFVWDGTKSSVFAGGNGTAENPYLIDNASQLAYVVSTDITDGLCFKLINDIRINDTNSEDWTDTAQNWVWGNIRFVGTFDGNGHTIDGLYFNGSQKRFGLFSFVGDSLIKNFNMTNAYIYNTVSSDAEGVAIVAGQTSAYAKFDGIFIDANSYVNAPSTKGVAGIVGRGSVNVDISNCAVLATLEGKSHVGAFYGTYWGGVQTLNNCYTASNVPAMPSRSLQNSANNYALVQEGYYDKLVTVLTEEQMKGEAAKTNMSTLDFNFVWQTVENGYPVLRENPFYDWWDGTKAESFAGGDGTEANPFLIENAAQLYKMVAEYYTHEASLGKFFEITKDIYISNPGTNYTFTGAKNWLTDYGSAIATVSKNNSFSGTLNGNGNKIYGLYISGKKSAGLFPGITSYSDIKNLAFDNVYITGGSGNAGAIAGSAYWYDNNETATITNCSVVNSTIGKGGNIGYVGGLVGHMLDCTITFTDCYSNSLSLSDWGTPGGIVGNAYESGKLFMVNCYSAGHYPVRANVNKAVCTNVYTDTARPENNTTENITVLESAQMTGEAAKTNMSGFNFNQIWQAGAEGEYPTYKSSEEKAMYWDGTVAEDFAVGEGTAEKPYEISTANELFLLANSDTNATKGKYYKLTNDIAVSATNEGWENENPFAWTKKTAYLEGFGYSNSFAGVLDGAGYTVSGLYFEDEITDNGKYAYGLIPLVTANAIIKNINVEGVYASVDGNAYVGAVAGAAHVTAEDAANPLNFVQFIGVNAANCEINAQNSADILGGASRGVKFELCNAEKLVGSYNEKVSIRNCNTDKFTYSDDIVVYTVDNVDTESLVNVTKYFLNVIDDYIVDINGDSTFDIRDLVTVKNALVDMGAEETLVWSQEFNDSALDYSVWRQNTTMSRGTTLEYIDTTSFNGETLTLSCVETDEKDANGDKIYGVNYGLDTIESMSFRYGRLEMRAKIPFAAGAFPSLWLTSRDAIGYEKNCEYSSEIDIFEVFAKTGSATQVTTCVHKWYNDENGNKLLNDEGKPVECSCGTGLLAGNTYNVEESDRSYTIEGDEQNEFHTFVFEWDENTMKFSVDGNVYYTIDRSTVEKLHFDLAGKNTDIAGLFEQFVCIRLNNHMYTTGEGAAYTYSGDASEIDASEINYEIDYIRLYQKNDGKSAINLK